MEIPPNVLGKLRGPENRIDPKPRTCPSVWQTREAPVSGHDGLCNSQFKGESLAKPRGLRAQGTGPCSGTSLGRGGEEMWETRTVPGPRACTRAGEEEGESSGQDRRGLRPPFAPHLISTGGSTSLRTGRCGPASLALNGVGGAGRGGGAGAGRVSREPLRPPPL